MKKSVLLIVLVAVVVAGAGVFAFLTFTGGSAATKAGECVVVSNHQDDRADVANAGCHADNAAYKVGKILPDVNAACPADLTEYTEIVANAGGGKLCLLPNFLEGACYALADTADDWGKSACTGANAVKITRVVAGASDLAGCPETEEGMAFPEPPVVYCFKPVAG